MKVGLKLNGKFIGCEPGTIYPYADRENQGLWESLEIIESDGYYSARFISADRQLSIQPGGRLETRDAGFLGLYELFTLKDGKLCSQVSDVVLELIGFSKGAILPRINGINFVDHIGERVSLNGTDQFCALRQFADGIDLTPYADESVELGFNLWRVFFSGSIKQNFVLDLIPGEFIYQKVRSFVEWVNSKGIIVLATIDVDMQDILTSADARAKNWSRMAKEMVGLAVLLSAGNQWNKNGWSPAEISDPGYGMLWSRGSGVEDVAPISPHGSFAEFHQRRDWPAGMLDTVASPVYLYDHGVNVPLLMTEPRGYNEDGSRGRLNDPKLAYRFARHYSTEWAGAIFHNDFGQSGRLMGPRTKECARAWTSGMRLL